MDIPGIRSVDVALSSGASQSTRPGTQGAAQADPSVPGVASGATASAAASGSSTPSDSGLAAGAASASASASGSTQAQVLKKAVAKLNQQLDEQSAGVTLSAGLDTSGQHPGQVLVELSDKQTNQTFYKHYLPPQSVIQAADESSGASGFLVSTRA